ncbi:MAG TPA: ABC transporter ATP-binding protein/permease [Bavariicoccus seileri]|uniref:ABC transporter ATP-binding protein/permease n=1 Tax=Bavariicoccus seileri TaxID=549685 RepID=A0A3D4S3U8_9ENTE|nr:ABC transporter ATP-binding protein/permease [Bavariicoccus seileri]HCS93493.1 ABC transporter ATP-binding protein/permease [Bavariicoccus seileri]
MIDERLFGMVKKWPLMCLVAFRLVNLGISITIWTYLAKGIAGYLDGSMVSEESPFGRFYWLFLGAIAIKSLLSFGIEKMTYQSSAELRVKLRHQVMAKAFKLEETRQMSAARLAQYSVDGIEQLEIYYSRFIPQLFYCVLASALIFGTLVRFAWQPALVLLLCMPLIPIVVMLVMKIAKKVLGKYWTEYTNLGVMFKENLSGLSTLKAFDQDGIKQTTLNQNAERFRKATMSLLSVQLNSITVMDIISYCGAALGIGLSLLSYRAGQLSLAGVFLFILLSAEFFIPMRQLGSLFHVAMNGITAMDRLFTYLDIPEPLYGNEQLSKSVTSVTVDNLSYTYPSSEPALQNNLVLKEVSLALNAGGLIAMIGKSGSGKSTFAKLISHRLVGYEGAVYWNNKSLSELSADSIKRSTLYVDSHGYLFKASIKDNLLLGKKDAADRELWEVLRTVQLTDVVDSQDAGLNTMLTENGGNLSGGQRQRLLLARALLKDVPFYVFDEITSGIDRRSEEIILDVLKELAKDRLVLFISHRLYNVMSAAAVAVFENGEIVEFDTPEHLKVSSTYFKAYFDQETELLNQTMANENRGGYND